MRREALKRALLPLPPPPNNQQNDKKSKKALIFKKPMIVGYMSVDVLRQYHNDLSQLKYLNFVPKGRLYFDLNHNIDKAVKRTTDDNNEKISLMLKFILNQKQNLKHLRSEELTFVSYHNTLISIMCNVYNRTPVTIVASLFNNCIYFCLMESPQEMLRRQSCKEQDKFGAWGYKFEQYMLSDLPHLLPDIEKPVLENEEFSLYYFSKLGNHRLFYGAQIDAMLATTKSPTTGIPETEDVNTNLKFLRKHGYVELITNKELYHPLQVNNFMKYKLLRCWCQCYLSGLKGLLVGYRNPDGIIQRVEWFDSAAIMKYCKGKWSPQIAFCYLDVFLNFVKHSFNSLKASLGENYNSTKPLTVKFHIDDDRKFKGTRTNDKAHIILPKWYIKNF